MRRDLGDRRLRGTSRNRCGVQIRGLSPRALGDVSNQENRNRSPEKTSDSGDADWRCGLRKTSVRKLEMAAVQDGRHLHSGGEVCARSSRTCSVRKIAPPERSWREEHISDQNRKDVSNSPALRGRDVLSSQISILRRQGENSAGTEVDGRESQNVRKDRSVTPQGNPRDFGLGFREKVRTGARESQTSSQTNCGRRTPDRSRRSWTTRGVGGVGVVAPAAQPVPPRISPPTCSLTSGVDGLFESLTKLGSLSADPMPCTYAQGQKNSDSVEVTNDLKQVRDLFAAQMPDVSVFKVWRIENQALRGVYGAVCDSMGVAGGERSLWHGTSLGSIRNIALNGFNRAYCGRHGMKFGHGTYFSAAADYSVRFCDKRNAQRVMLLANVLVGSWTKGSPELVEAPHKDTSKLTRYDSTVDDVDSPGIFCIFRDFQALPLYIVLFSGSIE